MRRRRAFLSFQDPPFFWEDPYTCAFMLDFQIQKPFGLWDTLVPFWKFWSEALFSKLLLLFLGLTLLFLGTCQYLAGQDRLITHLTLLEVYSPTENKEKQTERFLSQKIHYPILHSYFTDVSFCILQGHNISFSRK